MLSEVKCVRGIFDMNPNIGLMFTLSRNIGRGSHFPTPHLRIHLVLSLKTLNLFVTLFSEIIFTN